jgi:hypothetical protein
VDSPRKGNIFAWIDITTRKKERNERGVRPKKSKEVMQCASPCTLGTNRLGLPDLLFLFSLRIK